MEALEKSLIHKNLRIQVATGGGKTLYSYLLIHYLKTIVRGKIVIVVPRQDLANQVHTKYGYYSHFDDSFNMEDVSIVHSKSKHSPNNKIIFITFQTLVNYDDDFLSQIDVLIVDEAHESENKSLKSIISKCVNTKYKIGMSGTFDSKEETLTSDLCLQAMLGDMVNIVGQRDLINAGRASEFEGRVYVIKHRHEDVKRYKSLMNERNKKHKLEYDVLKNIKDKKVANLKGRISDIRNGYTTGDAQKLENQLDYLVNSAIVTENKRWGYADEVDFLKNLEARNHFIINTALANDKGNSLVVFNHIETHGDILHDLALTKMRKYDINLFYIHGNTKLRPDKATALIESSNKRVVVLANLSMVKEGWSVNNLHFCYVSMPLKSSKALRQLAGRLLRKDGTSTKTALYIFIDDLRLGDYINYSYEHGVGNIKTLMLENHEVKKMTIDLNEYFKGGK
jgi:superfamily II DNA or RNA helicase